jgi:hypothetical protein
MADQNIETRSPEPMDQKFSEAEDQREPRKYSKRYKNLQEFERQASKGVHRLVKSVEAGVREWRDATDRSARKRKDGALRDVLENSARAVGKQIRVASRAPQDAVRAVRALKITKALRRVFPL